MNMSYCLPTSVEFGLLVFSLETETTKKEKVNKLRGFGDMLIYIYANETDDWILDTKF